MISQSSRFVYSAIGAWLNGARSKRLTARTVVCLTLLILPFVSPSWIGSAIAADPASDASTKLALLNGYSRQSALNLGDAIATNLPSFRQYCTSAIAAAPPKPLCLNYIYGGSLDGELAATDELPGETPAAQLEAASADAATTFSATSLQPIDPYQYDKVQLFPLR